MTINIYGRVQNVGFRYYTHKTAIKYNITGFVKNESDGSVYLEAEGEEKDMDNFIQWLHDGPTWAQVEDIKLKEIPFQNYKIFTVH